MGKSPTGMKGHPRPRQCRGLAPIQPNRHQGWTHGRHGHVHDPTAHQYQPSPHHILWKKRNAYGRAKRPKLAPDYQGPLTRQLPTECQAILTGYTGTHFLPMSTARKSAGVENFTKLAAALSITTGKCLTYTMYGKCTWRSCKRQHTTVQTAKPHHSILDKTFQAHTVGK